MRTDDAKADSAQANKGLEDARSPPKRKTVLSGGQPVVLSSEASQTATSGATVVSRYHERQEDVVGVNMADLRDFKSASVEEFWQFVVGQFFAVGGFWLGLERLVTVGYWDALFLMCVVSVVAGCAIGFFGYRQLSRRQTRIDRIIASAQQQQASHQ